MMNASSRIFVLCSALSFSMSACGGGDDTTDPPPPPGATGGSGGGGSPAASNVIANCEDDHNALAHDGYFKSEAEGWEIAWFTYTDNVEAAAQGKGQGTIVPAEKTAFVCIQDATDTVNSSYVFNAKGGGFTLWGAGMGFNLKIAPEGTPPGLADLSKFTGIKFSIKVATPETGNVRVKMVDAQTTPVARGGTCDAALGACDNNFGQELANTTPGTWVDFQIPFASLKQETWSSQMFTTGPQITSVIGFQFQVKNNRTFDYSVDNFAFY
jgi:hypothetical protein